MTLIEMQAELADLRGLLSTVEEIMFPLLEEIETNDTDNLALLRRMRRLAESINDAREGLGEIEDDFDL